MQPYVVAHRGARGHAPENTLAAARLAHQEKAWMWELDTTYTRDGHLVVIHDDTLERTTDVASRPEFADRKPWKAHDFSLREIRSLDAGSWFPDKDPFGTVAAGEVSAAMAEAYKGEKIPTLEEALRLTRDLGWRVNVEIKDQEGSPWHERAAGEVCALVARLGMADAVLLSSFQHRYLREAASLLPDTPRGALVEGSRPQDAAALCAEARAAFYHPDHKLLSPEDMPVLREAAVAVNVWTVNTPEDMRRAIALGVHGIITDFPKRLCGLLEQITLEIVV
ncbi:MAG: glycerophosphodiester phosphodiesterase [Deltaproteobacteria bacterium]|jgi:glycerophosphoryl diester phosphodiesterase|nr:glycerophosphodiester phosphodiesterase [Deltaproteobacteria bacterium]